VLAPRVLGDDADRPVGGNPGPEALEDARPGVRREATIDSSSSGISMPGAIVRGIVGSRRASGAGHLGGRPRSSEKNENPYQTSQALAGRIGAPSLHWNASPNFG